MTLKAVIDDATEVPEAFKSEYVEKDGKFYLDLDGSLNTHTSILPLANALRNAKQEKQALQAKVTLLESRMNGLPEDFDPHKYEELLAENETLKKDPNRDKDNEAVLQRMRDQYDQRLRAAEEKRVADLRSKENEIEERDNVIQSHLVDGGLTEALVKAGVAKEFLTAAKALLRNTVKVKREEDGKRRAIVETDLGEVDVEKFVDNWSKSDDGKPFVIKGQGAGSQGSGVSRPGGETNPWDIKSRNLTEQGRIIKQDRVKAERLMRQAGLSASQIQVALTVS